MFKQMRRKEREMARIEAEEILRNGTYGVLSMNCENGFAYGVPLGYVYTGAHIYFHWALEGQKLACIRNNNKVSFCVVEKADVLPEHFSMQYASAIVYGEVSVANNEEKMAALMAFVKKYAGGFVEKGKEYAAAASHKTVVVKMEIAHITGKARK